MIIQSHLRYDPLEINEYENNGIIGIRIFNTIISGISSFYRVGDLTLKMIDNNLIISMIIIGFGDMWMD